MFQLFGVRINGSNNCCYETLKSKHIKIGYSSKIFHLKKIPDARGQIFFHAFTGPDWVYCPTLNSMKNVGMPARTRHTMNGIRNAPKIGEKELLLQMLRI